MTHFKVRVYIIQCHTVDEISSIVLWHCMHTETSACSAMMTDVCVRKLFFFSCLHPFWDSDCRERCSS